MVDGERTDRRCTITHWTNYSRFSWQASGRHVHSSAFVSKRLAGWGSRGFRICEGGMCLILQHHFLTWHHHLWTKEPIKTKTLNLFLLRDQTVTEWSPWLWKVTHSHAFAIVKKILFANNTVYKSRWCCIQIMNCCTQNMLQSKCVPLIYRITPKC